MRTAAAVSAAHRARTNRAAEGESGRSPATGSTSRSSSYNTAHGYGTLSPALVPASYGAEQPAGPPATAAAIEGLPPSESYHGHLYRADGPTPASEVPSSTTASTSSSACGDESNPLPSYSDFKLAHYLLDMPITLLILGIFSILAVFGWPVPDSPYPHHVHWKQLGLGAITWISTEAIRRRIFRFLGTSRYPILRSTPFLLLLHTFTQELLRLFAIRLTFPRVHEDNAFPPSPPTLLQVVHAVAGFGILGTPPRPPKGFFRAFHLSLGFAAAENIWQTLIMLGQVRLYEEVLSPPSTKPWLVGEENVATDGFANGSPETLTVAPFTEQVPSILDDENFVTSALVVSDDELEGYFRERKRLEFEDSFGGEPLWNISVFVIGMWRLDAMLLNLSLTLLLSLPFHHNSLDVPPRRHPALPIHLPLWPTFFAVVLLHWLLSLAWTLGIRDRRRFSLAGISYVTLVGVLGTFFACLGIWSALV